MGSAPLPPLAVMAGGATNGAEAGWAGVLTRRLAALAMRRATEDFAERAEGAALLPAGALAAGLAAAALVVAVALLLRLRLAALLRADGVALALAAEVALAFGFIAGLALALARVVRALAGVTSVRPADSLAGVAEVTAGRRRDRAGDAALAALAAGRD